MIRYYVSENGVLKEVDKDRMKDAVWIDLVAPDPDEAEMMSKEFEIDLQDIADCLDPNERSRVEIAEEYDLVVLGCTLEPLLRQWIRTTIPEQIAQACDKPLAMVKASTGLRGWLRRWI